MKYRPVMVNSGMGLLSTVVNVYSMQDGNWSITAVITGSIILGCLVVSGALYLYLEQFVIPFLSANNLESATRGIFLEEKEADGRG